MKRPYVVGISGGTASGKSTLARWLEGEMRDLRVKVFHMDEYFKPDSVRPKAASPVTGNVYYDDNCPETIYADKLREDLSQAIMGMQMACAYVGTMVMPSLFGMISGKAGIRLYPFYLLGITAVMVLMVERLNGLKKGEAEG